MTHFICISGAARHGKDTSAQILKEELENRGYSTLVIHYADLLKFICEKFFGWDGNKDEYGRSLLQHVGTDCVRANDPDYWVDFVAQIVRMFPEEWDYVIVPDTRFPNEISRIADAGFPSTHIRITREGFENNLTAEQKSHKSETALNNTAPDVWINNTTLEALRSEVVKACDLIVKEKIECHEYISRPSAQDNAVQLSIWDNINEVTKV